MTTPVDFDPTIFGAPKYIRDPNDPAGFLANPAAVLEMAASEDTPQTVAFRAAIVEAWPRWKDRPLPESDRQFGALSEALAAINTSIEMPGQMALGSSKH